MIYHAGFARLCTHLTLLGITTVRAAAPRAGGPGWAESFDGLQGTTISMKWDHTPISALTIEYWMAIMDVHLTQQPVFAYSAYNVAGRYGAGGPPYENANEVRASQRPLLRSAHSTRSWASCPPLFFMLTL